MSTITVPSEFLKPNSVPTISVQRNIRASENEAGAGNKCPDIKNRQGRRVREERKHHFVQLPEFLLDALRDEQSLSTTIRPPENLLSNLFDGLEEQVPKATPKRFEHPNPLAEEEFSLNGEDDG